MAIIQFFDDIFQDAREARAQINGSDALVQAFAFINEAIYSPMNIAEHFMQYTMLLAMTESHRVWEGEIISWGDYNLIFRDNIIKKILNPEQWKKYQKYKEDERNKKNQIIDNTDYLSRFLMYDKSITAEQRSKFVEEYTKTKKNKKELFESLPTLYSKINFEN